MNVSFISEIYAIVPFGINGAGLRDHLLNAEPHTDGIYYIKVTGLTAADLKGNASLAWEMSTLGVRLNYSTKKVALKLEEIQGLTNMKLCFYNYTSLTRATVIPSSVTNIKSCFENCKKITTVTPKCNYNSEKDDVFIEPVFKDAFKNCENLTAGSIKVPAEQLQTYKGNAAIMGAQADWFVAE